MLWGPWDSNPELLVHSTGWSAVWPTEKLNGKELSLVLPTSAYTNSARSPVRISYVGLQRQKSTTKSVILALFCPYKGSDHEGCKSRNSTVPSWSDFLGLSRSGIGTREGGLFSPSSPSPVQGHAPSSIGKGR